MLEGIVRESIGGGSAKRLKRDGYLIANIYANGLESVFAAFKRGDFIRAARSKTTLTLPVSVDGKEYNTVIQEYQFHPVTGDITFTLVDINGDTNLVSSNNVQTINVNL